MALDMENGRLPEHQEPPDLFQNRYSSHLGKRLGKRDLVLEPGETGKQNAVHCRFGQEQWNTGEKSVQKTQKQAAEKTLQSGHRTITGGFPLRIDFGLGCVRVMG